MVLVEELGLDGAQSAAVGFGLLGHEVDADVAEVAVCLTVGPVHPAPDVGEPRRAVDVGMTFERVRDEALERRPPCLGRGITRT